MTSPLRSIALMAELLVSATWAPCLRRLCAVLADCMMPACCRRWENTPRNSVPLSETNSMGWDVASASTVMPASRQALRSPVQDDSAVWSGENETYTWCGRDEKAWVMHHLLPARDTGNFPPRVSDVMISRSGRSPVGGSATMGRAC